MPGLSISVFKSGFLLKTVLLVSVFIFLERDSLFCQITRVKGKVLDAETGEALPFVSISVKGLSIGTNSDIDGNFEIEFQKSADTLLVSFLGYTSRKIKILPFTTNYLTIKLSRESRLLKEITIRPTENPAHRIMREVISHKIYNDPENLNSYCYDVYNKIEFDLNNFGKKNPRKKILKPLSFIYNYRDSTEDGISFIPLGIAEAYTRVYYMRKPERMHEYIKASRISGIKNTSLSQFLGDMYQTINIYDNFLDIFGKSFVSPVTDNFLRYYKYFLIDSVYIGKDRCYKLLFLPKRKEDLTFTGNIFIHDSTWAVRQVRVSFNENANINYIKSFDVTQDYTLVDGKFWMLREEKSIGDFSPLENSNGIGFFGKKTTSYSNFNINRNIPDSLFKTGSRVSVEDSSGERSDAFWEHIRPNSLSDREKDIYFMVDSLKKVKQLRSAWNLSQMVVTGYYPGKYFEPGKINSFLSWNSLEGIRLKFGGRTSNEFSRRMEIKGMIAYGTEDNRFKYKTEIRWFIDKDKSKRRLLNISYKSDIEQLSISQGAMDFDNILSSITRRVALRNMNNVVESKISIENEWFPGFMNRVSFLNRDLTPLGDFKFERELNGITQSIKNIGTSEFGILTRFAFGEKYIQKGFDRIPVPGRYPVVQLELTRGIKGIMKSNYNYLKTKLRFNHRLPINPYGHTNFMVEFGKIWGRAPYLFLEVHQGSQTYLMDKVAFNLMNIFEFTSDRYVYMFIDHHFEGYLLNKIPLLKKLKWREIFTLKSAIGDLKPENLPILKYPGGKNPVMNKPYIESGFAIENIFKVLRVDLLWRMTHLDKPDVKPAGFRISLNISF